MAEQSQDRSVFDPRFDPAFQPGYDAASDPNVRARAVRPGPAAEGRRAPLAPTPALPPLAPPPGRPATIVSRPLDAETEGSEDSDVTDAQAADIPSPLVIRDLTRNPFVIALWVLSVVFVIIGGGLLRWVSMALETLNNSGDPGFDFLLVQALQFAGPLFIVLGCGIASGTLFLFASRWRAAGRD